MKKYYIVDAKCGHVGNGRYIKISFPIYADNKRSASDLARCKGGVKHHHRDAIISVMEVSQDEFLKGQYVLRADPYWDWTRTGMEILGERITREPPYPPPPAPIFKKHRGESARHYRYKKGQQQLQFVKRDFDEAVREAV